MRTVVQNLGSHTLRDVRVAACADEHIRVLRAGRGASSADSAATASSAEASDRIQQECKGGRPAVEQRISFVPPHGSAFVEWL